MSAVVDLLRLLVSKPSVSGDEGHCRDALADWLEAHGISVTIHGRNVLATVEGSARSAGGQGRGLLLCSHIDVVPVGEGWSRDPWDAALSDGMVFGRGANDAKSSVAAMAVAAAEIDRSKISGRLVLAFVCDEETGGEGIEACHGDLPPFDAAIVGEPTGLDVCPGQRGLLRAKVVSRGRACHASRPWEGVNAVELSARDVLSVQQLELPGVDPLLGPPTLQATVIAGGTRPNVLPGECAFELDGRPTPECDNERLLEILRGAVNGEVVVRSNRYLPVRTAQDAEIVSTALAASPTGVVRGFGGVSDMFHLGDTPAVVMGPGTSAASHAPDEWVAVSQVEAAAQSYAAIARSYLAVQCNELSAPSASSGESPS
ncbi:MAG: acetylornithine deacetylase [Pseudohongiellaceae bacterium]|jgi:acetylornithine deacetylase